MEPIILGARVHHHKATASSGVRSDRRAATGQRLVINNWTVGSVERDMELLSFVPVTHRFRLP